jgi:hypothetical protein
MLKVTAAMCSTRYPSVCVTRLGFRFVLIGMANASQKGRPPPTLDHWSESTLTPHPISISNSRASIAIIGYEMEFLL